jgi:hypothetical protein
VPPAVYAPDEFGIAQARMPKTRWNMAKDPRLHLQVADGHLRLMPQGDLTEPKIKQILRAAEVGLRVFPMVVVDLRTSKESTKSAINLLEEGMQRIIAKRKHVLLTP